MGITDFSFRLLLLFMPGLIAFIIVDNLTVHRTVKLHHWIIYSFLLGIASYMIWFVISECFFYFHGMQNPYDLLEHILQPQKHVQTRPLIAGSMVSIILGLFISWFVNKKHFYRFAQMISVSNRYGDVDLFQYIMNNNIPKWVYVRDVSSDRLYYGFICAWSGPDEKEGILLRDVKVYENKTGKWCYDSPALYLPKKIEEYIIEFPSVEYTDYMIYGNQDEEDGINE